MKRINIINNLFLYFFLAVSALFLDQITKRLAVDYLKPIGSYDLVNGVFRLTYRENTGAAFSILEGKRLFFILISVFFVILLSIVLFTGIINSLSANCMVAIILGGGAGNFVDRALNGYVVDMFDFCLINFAVFNFADICITCGSVIFLILYITYKGDMIKWK